MSMIKSSTLCWKKMKFLATKLWTVEWLGGTQPPFYLVSWERCRKVTTHPIYIFFNEFSHFFIGHIWSPEVKCFWMIFRYYYSSHCPHILLFSRVLDQFWPKPGKYSHQHHFCHRFVKSIGNHLLTINRIYSDLLGKHSFCSRATHIKDNLELWWMFVEIRQ